MKPKSKPPSPTLRKAIDPEVLRAVAKAKCEHSHLFFTRYFFKHRQGIPFHLNWHHALIADTVQKVIDGELKNVVINVPPGSSKTELVAINLIARGLALNPRARFLHISYSDDLALLNSEMAREIIRSEEYQALWPLAIAQDAKSKKRWNVLLDGKKAGGVYAVSLGGQITGFRAGHMAPGWQGALIIDDPLKVEDAYSKAARDKANRKLVSTVKSRKAQPDTPIVVIMQRLAQEDPTGFIQIGKVPGDWTFVSIPALLDDAYVAALPSGYRDKIDASQRDKHGRFSYWPYKEPLNDLCALEQADRYVFTSQYQQQPRALGGDLIKSEWFSYYETPPRIRLRKVYADTAQKTAEHNDYSVFQLWGLGEDNRLYLLDLIRGKWPAPELKRRAIAFWNSHKPYDHKTSSPLAQLLVEDKSSGTGLIQDIQEDGRIPVKGIPRGTDKLTRIMGVLAYIESGRITLPKNAPWVKDFIAECEAFTANNTHAHDDQIDPMIDAITDCLAKSSDWSGWT
ncbi:phage terminase large subunit [Mycoavidus cysteinexigens]|uniref:phage terminase large subunit n=1 Tax=Mycoavidus cysteinexigens TaxID=1553431 RepID=UPI0005EF06A5|nr:phage terminase large subunit [Mycoavidus cysteinexigens]